MGMECWDFEFESVCVGRECILIMFIGTTCQTLFPSVFNYRKPSFVSKHTAVDESECANESGGEHCTDESTQSGLDVSKLPQG